MTALLTEQPIENRKSKIVNPQQDRAIIALLTQPSIAAAAQSCGLGESTLRRWLHQPDFAHAYAQARQQAFSVALGCLQRLSEQAVQTLQSLVQDPQISPSVRLSAARTILQISFKAAEKFTFQPRLNQLETGPAALESEQKEDPYPQQPSPIDNRQRREEDGGLNRSDSTKFTQPFPFTRGGFPREAGTPASDLGARGEELEGVGSDKTCLSNPSEAGGIPCCHKEEQSLVTPFPVSAANELGKARRSRGGGLGNSTPLYSALPASVPPLPPSVVGQASVPVNRECRERGTGGEGQASWHESLMAQLACLFQGKFG